MLGTFNPQMATAGINFNDSNDNYYNYDDNDSNNSDKMMIIVVIIIVIMITVKDSIPDDVNLLTASRTVYVAHAHVAKAQCGGKSHCMRHFFQGYMVIDTQFIHKRVMEGLLEF